MTELICQINVTYMWLFIAGWCTACVMIGITQAITDRRDRRHVEEPCRPEVYTYGDPEFDIWR